MQQRLRSPRRCHFSFIFCVHSFSRHVPRQTTKRMATRLTARATVSRLRCVLHLLFTRIFSLCRQGIWQRQSQRCQRLWQRKLRKSKRLWQRQGQGRPLHGMKCCTRCRRLRFGHGGYLTIEGHVALHMLSHMWGHFMFDPSGR